MTNPYDKLPDAPGFWEHETQFPYRVFPFGGEVVDLERPEWPRATIMRSEMTGVVISYRSGAIHFMPLEEAMTRLVMVGANTYKPLPHDGAWLLDPCWYDPKLPRGPFGHPPLPDNVRSDGKWLDPHITASLLPGWFF